MSMPSPTQWLIILAILLLLFGATRLPKLARSLGESARIFKSEVQTMREDEDEKDKDDESARGTVEGPVIDPTASEGVRKPEREDRR